MSFRVERTFRFESAHRLPSHPGKCSHLHGHSYVATIIFDRPELDAAGMVVELDALDKTIGAWIAQHLDHGTLVAPKDTRLIVYLGETGSKHLAIDPEPTCEAIARTILAAARHFHEHSGVAVVACRVQETESCVAEAR